MQHHNKAFLMNSLALETRLSTWMASSTNSRQHKQYVMQSIETRICDACDVSLSVYIHTEQAWKICLTTVGIEPTTKAWGTTKVVGSIPTVARHIFRACPVWIYTQSNITSCDKHHIHLSTITLTQKNHVSVTSLEYFRYLWRILYMIPLTDTSRVCSCTWSFSFHLPRWNYN
jgi:hypothetical protein